MRLHRKSRLTSFLRALAAAGPGDDTQLQSRARPGERFRPSDSRITVRPADQGDVPALVELLDAYMHDAFKARWHGSVEAFRRDGFGREFETLVADQGGGTVIGFAAWMKSYDLHSCVRGGYILDLYVAPACRGRGVAAALIVAIAAETRRQGGKYLIGRPVENRGTQRLYARVARRFPGTYYIVGGRAFRRLAELAGRSTRGMIQDRPEISWNDEP